MSIRADVYVRNQTAGTLKVGQAIQGRTEGTDMPIEKGKKGKFHLAGPEVEIIVAPPTGTDIKECPITLRSDVDLSIHYSRSESQWKIKTTSGKVPPDAPLTVNLTVGEDDPEPPDCDPPPEDDGSGSTTGG